MDQIVINLVTKDEEVNKEKSPSEDDLAEESETSSLSSEYCSLHSLDEKNIEDNLSDSSMEIIPKFLFNLPYTSEKITENNTYLDFKTEQILSSSTDVKDNKIEDIDTYDTFVVYFNPNFNPDSQSSSEDPSFVLEIDESDDEFSDAKSHISSESYTSWTLQSEEEDQLIPNYLFKLPEDDVIRPELELVFNFSDEIESICSGISSEVEYYELQQRSEINVFTVSYTPLSIPYSYNSAPNIHTSTPEED